MSNLTLIMSRTPIAEFEYQGLSGRWGNMIVVKGAKIQSVRFCGQNDNTTESFKLNGQSLSITKTDENSLEFIAEFDTMERFRFEGGSFYMQVKPRPNHSYILKKEIAGDIKKLNGSGQCLRVYGHGYPNKATGGIAGILVHEAPHVGWLIGCISPRELNHRQDWTTDPTRSAMNKIFQAMDSNIAELFVLDW